MKKLTLLLTLLLASTMIVFGCSANDSNANNNKDKEPTTSQNETEEQTPSVDEEAETALHNFLELMVNEDYEGMIPYLAQANMDKSQLTAEKLINTMKTNDEEQNVDRLEYRIDTFEQIDDKHFNASYTIKVKAGEEELSYEETAIMQLENEEWKVNFTGEIDTKESEEDTETTETSEE